MSYARWGWEGSDVYIFEAGPDNAPYLTCCGCGDFATYGELMVHIDDHRARRDHVPAHVDERIATEIAAGTNGIPAGDIPAVRVPDPGVQRPEPELFTRLKNRR